MHFTISIQLVGEVDGDLMSKKERSVSSFIKSISRFIETTKLILWMTFYLYRFYKIHDPIVSYGSTSLVIILIRLEYLQQEFNLCGASTLVLLVCNAPCKQNKFQH